MKFREEATGSIYYFLDETEEIVFEAPAEGVYSWEVDAGEPDAPDELEESFDETRGAFDDDDLDDI